MKHLKKFKLFENDSFNASDMNVIGTYGPDEHEEFCEAAYEWYKKTGIGNAWSLYYFPKSHFEQGIENRKLRRKNLRDRHPDWASKTDINDNTWIDQLESEYLTSLRIAKRYWDQYVKDDKKMSLVEMGDSLFAVLHDDNQIIMAYNHEDRKVADTSIFQGLL